MRRLLLLALLPLAAACSTVRPAMAPVVEPAEVDVSGRWVGYWVGTGIFNSPREDTARVDLVQNGNLGRGRIVFEGTTAAESVPEQVRFQGLAGIRVVAQVSGSKVTIRHEYDSRLFAVDLVAVEADRMVGDVRAPFPGTQLVLVRDVAPVAPEARRAPEPAPVAAPVVVTEPPPVSPAPPTEVAAVVPEPTPTPQVEPAVTPQAEESTIPELSAIHFDFNKAVIRTDALGVLSSHVSWLKEHPDAEVLIEGHCDEKGTSEYNMALGERRAKSVREYLATAGVDTSRVSTVSYGKQQRLCEDATDECRSQNRRAEFRLKNH
jgi:peptidoglycan-associated lipoprotein